MLGHLLRPDGRGRVLPRGCGLEDPPRGCIRPCFRRPPFPDPGRETVGNGQLSKRDGSHRVKQIPSAPPFTTFHPISQSRTNTAPLRSIRSKRLIAYGSGEALQPSVPPHAPIIWQWRKNVKCSSNLNSFFRGGENLDFACFFSIFSISKDRTFM